MKACLCRRWALDLRPRALLSTGPAEGYSLLGFHCLENKGEEEVDLPGQAFLPSLTRRSQHHRLCCLHRIATTNMVVIGKKNGTSEPTEAPGFTDGIPTKFKERLHLGLRTQI